MPDPRFKRDDAHRPLALGAERLYRFNLQPESDQQFPAFVNLQQFYVEQYLVEKCADVPASDLRWNNKVVDLRPLADGVEVEVETPDGRYRTRCAYLVGADGTHSLVREKLGAKDAESALFEDYWCIADVRMAPSEEAVRKAYLDNPQNDGGAIWYHQMADGVWRTDWQIVHFPDPDAEATPARATERLKKLLGLDTPFEIVWVGPWRFRKRYVEQDRLHDALALLIDGLPAERRTRALARLAATLAARLGDYDAALDAIRIAGSPQD